MVACILDPANQAALVDVLNYHVVAGELDSGAVASSGGLGSGQAPPFCQDPSQRRPRALPPPLFLCGRQVRCVTLALTLTLTVVTLILLYGVRSA